MNQAAQQGGQSQRLWSSSLRLVLSVPHPWGQQGQEVTTPQVYLLPEGEGPADSSPWRPRSWEGAQSLSSASVSSPRPLSTL